MAFRKAAPPTPVQRRGARGNISIADLRSPIAKPSFQLPQVVTIRAELIGSDCCSALGITARSSAPVLALCRELVAAGFDQDASLEAWRDDVLCLRIRTIGEGARLRVSTHGVGFERFSECTEGPPVRKNETGHTRCRVHPTARS